MPNPLDYDADGTIAHEMLDEQERQREEECKAAGEAAFGKGLGSEANPHAGGTPYHGWWFYGWARAADVDSRRHQ